MLLRVIDAADAGDTLLLVMALADGVLAAASVPMGEAEVVPVLVDIAPALDLHSIGIITATYGQRPAPRWASSSRRRASALPLAESGSGSAWGKEWAGCWSAIPRTATDPRWHSLRKAGASSPGRLTRGRSPEHGSAYCTKASSLEDALALPVRFPGSRCGLARRRGWRQELGRA